MLYCHHQTNSALICTAVGQVNISLTLSTAVNEITRECRSVTLVIDKGETEVRGEETVCEGK